MSESGMESMINHNRPSFDVNECTECGSMLIEKIKSKYAVHYICHNDECPAIVFKSESRRKH